MVLLILQRIEMGKADLEYPCELNEDYEVGKLKTN